MNIIHNDYNQLISLENILGCWQEFKKGKSKKPDVMGFERYLEDNIFQLNSNLASQAYRHGPYHTFHIYDPKYRIISKATVRDRLVHHLVFKELYRIFEPSFICHSYSSRLNKGTHLAAANLVSRFGSKPLGFSRTFQDDIMRACNFTEKHPIRFLT